MTGPFKAALVLCLLSVSACSPSEGGGQHQLDEIADACGLPRETLTLRTDGFVVTQFAREEKFEAIECALKKIKNTEFKSKLGFIGNEISPEAGKQ